LILERSIQERRERMFTKAKSRPRPDPTPQPKSKVPNTPTPQVQPPTPAPAPQPPSQLFLNNTTGFFTSLELASAKCKASKESSALPKPAKRNEEVARREEPPADVKTSPSPSEDFVELVCDKCDVKQLRSSLGLRPFCRQCPRGVVGSMKCVGCGTVRVRNIRACAGCRGRFK